MRSKNIAYCAILTALIIIGAFIRIPLPPVPFTLQTMFVALAGLICGAKTGALACMVYLLLGIVGVPVFTSGGGVGYLIMPSAGFLFGFIGGAFTTGLISKKIKAPAFANTFVAVLTGYAVIYIIALLYAYICANFITGQPLAAKTLAISYFAVFIPSDLAKAAVASYIYVRLRKSGINF